MTNELKPCPFCGAKADVVHYQTALPDIDDELGEKWFVYCTNQDCGVGTSDWTDEREAVSVWNRRAGEPHA